MFRLLLSWFFLGMCASAAAAQYGLWQPLPAQFGQGHVLCSEAEQGAQCFALQCHPTRGFEFAVYSTVPDPSAPNAAVLRLDDGPEQVLNLRDVGVPGQKIQNVDYGGGDLQLLADLGRGTMLTLGMKQSHQFPVSGADRVISDILHKCQNVPSTIYKSFAEITAEAQKAKPLPPDQTYLNYLLETDSWGEDLDGGLTNPALRNIDHEACIRRCLGRADCKLATFNTDKNVCFLKSRFGSLIRDENAVTTFVHTRPTAHLAPALPGPAAPITEENRASPLIPWETTVAQRRAAAVPMGGPCQAELDAVRAMAATIRTTQEPGSTAAGAPTRLAWTAQPLTMRVPAWVVLSADRPVRFAGDGAYGLNAGAIGPFGLEVDRARQRGIVPLYVAQNLRGGAIDVVPLEAGPYNLRATLVTYLRACQQEVPLAQTSYAIDVTTAPPQIVLRDVTEAYPYDRRIEVPEFQRRIEISDTRFQIQHSADGSEILAREGKDLRLSPTKRFVVLANNEHYEIIDIVDGATVGVVKGMKLAFWHADSFFLTDYFPRGHMRMGATILPRGLGEALGTVGSCCFNDGTGTLHVDLENNVATLINETWSLLNSESLGIVGQNNYAQTTGSFRPEINSRIDAVAPLYDGFAWNTPLGPFYVDGVSHNEFDDRNDPERQLIAKMATQVQTTIPNPAFGKPSSSQDLAATNIITRGASETFNSASGFVSAMRRIGVSLSEGQLPQTWLRVNSDYIEPQKITGSHLEQLQKVAKKIERDVEQAGKQIEWSKPIDNPDQASFFCEHFPGTIDDIGLNTGYESAQSFSAYDLHLAFRFGWKERVVWVTRSTCRGGSLGGNLMSSASLNIFDSNSSLATHAEHRVDRYDAWAADFSRGIFETGFEAKLFQDRYIVTYAPGEGALMVFDLNKREFLMKTAYARRGDLLEDVFLGEDGQFLYQLNTNGSFTVYDLTRAEPVLEGRYLDDEIVIWTASFHFDSTEEGDAFVELRFPGRPGQYSFQQFQNALHVPGLMQMVLAGSVDLPAIDLQAPPRLEGRLSASPGMVDGIVRVTAQNPVAELSVFQDGVLTARQPAQDGEVAIIKTPRLPGARWVSVVAEDSAGLISLPVNVDLGGVGQTLPRVHFFGVGVDYYASGKLGSLNYAKRDVLRLSKTMQALNGQRLNLVSNTLLADRRASRDAILQQLQQIVNNAQTGDHIVVFMAGHGLRTGDGSFYLGLSGTELDQLDTTGLNLRAVAGKLARRDIRITILLDACHAGAAGSGAFATNDGAVGALIDKGQANVTVIAAAKGRQVSGESSDIGGGYFSAAVSQVLLEKRGEFDKNANGVLEAVEFYRGVKSLVTRQRGLDQTPWMVRNQIVGDYALF